MNKSISLFFHKKFYMVLPNHYLCIDNSKILMLHLEQREIEGKELKSGG